MKQWESLNYGGTMRLGSIDIRLTENSKINEIYKKTIISERHRHRYDVNNIFSLELERNGFHITGRCLEHNLVEIVELDKKEHPWYIGVQYHPEYQSSPLNPHPLFVSYIRQCIP